MPEFERGEWVGRNIAHLVINVEDGGHNDQHSNHREDKELFRVPG